MAFTRSGDWQGIQLGQTSKDIITDTAAHAPTNHCYAILHAVTDCVINALTDATAASGSMAGVTLKAGDRYYGQVTSVTLTSGTMIAYYL